MHAQSQYKLVTVIGIVIATLTPTAVWSAQAGPAATAVSANGKVLTLDDYPSWKRIPSAVLSPNGRWIAWAQQPNEGEDTLFIRELDGAGVHALARGSGPRFSNDSRWVAYTVTAAGQRQGGRGQGGGQRGQTPPQPQRGQGAGAPATPARTLQLIDLQSSAKYEVPDVESFAFSSNARFLGVRRNRAQGVTHTGSDVVLRDLRDGTVRNIGNVSEYGFNDSGSLLAYTVDAADRAGNGIYLMDLQSQLTTTLDAASSEYTQFAWSEDGTALAALRGTKPEGKVHRENVLLAWTGLPAKPVRVEYDPARDASFPAGFVASDLADVQLTRDNARVLFGVKPQDSEPPRSDDPPADLEVWHWKDSDVQSVQKVRAEQTRRFTYAAVYNLAARRFVKLADDDMRTVTVTADGRWAIGRLDTPYRHELSWGGARADNYRLDLETGSRQLLVSALRRAMGTSPDGKWFVYVKDEKVQAQNLASGKTVDFSALAGVDFIDREDDHDYEKPAYGVAGWTRDGKAVILNHKYDLWLLPLEAGKPVNFTAGLGEAEQIRFRIALAGGGGGGRGGGPGAGARDDRGIDITKPVRLTAYGEWTKKSGYYEVKLGEKPRPLIFVDAAVGALAKADSADRVLFTRQTFREFPDYWVASTSLNDGRKVTDANPQLKDYAWGRRVLIDYADARGNKLQATLALPANYQAGQRYPMLVYFYEKMSQQHHQFSMPVYDDRPHMSTYASDGYLVLQPDIVYEIGKPGSSALDDVGSAVRKVIELGYADPARIGLQGHSWGGYQSSFMVTQTDMFAAVVTGAPPTNLVSFYNELYKSTGTVQQGITEIGQVRMGNGATPWTAHELYESQSPIHQAEKITTPFMILHGTADGAVDWHQGLEFYNAARRLGKKVILLSYNNEDHHLGRRENQKDFQIRMKQFFDHYLKGKPAPKWMTDGTPYAERNKPPTIY
jgi:dipeptidyl aminopeptidase/acylaminoacyl peptidase